MSKRQRRSWGERLVLAVNIGAMLTALALAVILNAAYQRAAAIERVQLAGTLTVNEDSQPGDRVINLLLVGYDSSAGLDPDDPVQIGRQGESLGDVIIVAHIDEREQTAALLSIPRDLWVPIAGFDRSLKINSAFSLGGPATLIDTIEEELEIPIHHYASVDFAGFEDIVAALGSVEIFFDAPARDWNANPASGPPRSQTGFEMLATGCQFLDSREALSYVRSRYYQKQDESGEWYTTRPVSDIGRMSRQQDFLQATVQEAINQGARNPFVLSDLVDKAFDSVTIDQELTPQLMIDLGNTFRRFEPGELDTYSLPTNFDFVGSTSVLFEIEDASEPILEIFRGVPRSDPSTVNVSVVRSTDAEDEGDAVVDKLSTFGFDVQAASIAPSESGVIIRHGGDGLQAAQLVWFGLEGNAVIQQVPGLNGRDVVVLVGADSEAGDETGAPATTAPTNQTTTSLTAADLEDLESLAPETDQTQDPTAQPSSVDECG